MKRKLLLSFQATEKRLWSKETREQKGVEYILVAELPNEEGVLYSSTLRSEELEERYKENSCKAIKEISITKENGVREMQILWEDERKLSIKKENFSLLFLAEEIENGKETENSLLVFNVPKLLGEKICLSYFHLDQKENAGTRIFWLIKELI